MSLELLGLGLDFLSGGLGMMNAQNDRKMAQRQMQQAQRQFDAQMDQSIQRRVKDAKNAGVHPLFAMGASVGASPTISSNDPQQSGNPMGAALSSMAATLNALETNKASARRDNAEAALLDSERKRIEQDLMSQGRDTDVIPKPKPGNPDMGPSVEMPPPGSGSQPETTGPGSRKASFALHQIPSR